MLGLHYPTDDEVSGDAELQRWIQDIFTEGFLVNSSSGMCSVPLCKGNIHKKLLPMSYCSSLVPLLHYFPVLNKGVRPAPEVDKSLKMMSCYDVIALICIKQCFFQARERSPRAVRYRLKLISRYNLRHRRYYITLC